MKKMERRFGKYAIPNLMRYIIVLYIVGAVVMMTAPSLYTRYLALDFGEVLKGQIWRLFTFLLIPSDGSIVGSGGGIMNMMGDLFFMLLFFYMYGMMGAALERRWGTFAFNLFFFLGILFHILAAAITWFVFGDSFTLGTYYLNLSLFFAFVTEFSETQFLLFFIIPIKAKWLGIIDAALFAVTIIGGFAGLVNPMIWVRLWNLGIAAFPQNSVAALVSVLNYVLFFYIYRQSFRLSPAQRQRQKQFKAQVMQAKKQQAARDGGPRHRCAVCGRTELDAPDMEFRFCSKCDGEYEYCQEHLYTHQHVTKNQ